MGYIAGDGEFVGAADHLYCGSFETGIGQVSDQRDDLSVFHYYVDANGRHLFGGRTFDEAEDFSDGVSRVVEDGVTMLIDRQGDTIVDAERRGIDAIGHHSHDMRISFKEGELWGYLSAETGDVAISPRFQEAGTYSEGLACVRELGADDYGFVDLSGDWVIPAIYAEYGFFFDGLCAVREGDADTYCYINQRGETVLEGFRDASEFTGGIAEVELCSGSSVLINCRGDHLYTLHDNEQLLDVIGDRIQIHQQIGDAYRYRYLTREGERVT